MSVVTHADLHRIGQEEFGEIAYRILQQIFILHNELGRFLDEEIYKNAVVRRLEGAESNIRIEVRYEDFAKQYLVDLLVDGGALFELRAVRTLGAEHRSQLLNYLMLTGLSHGKLVNMRTDLVQHEFVNTSLTLGDRATFQILVSDWKDPVRDGRSFQAWFEGFLREVGVGLDLHLYQAAVSHFFGGTVQDINIEVDGNVVGSQRVQLATVDWGVTVTMLVQQRSYEEHLRRFLRHTPLSGIHWINITRRAVTFKSLPKAV